MITQLAVGDHGPWRVLLGNSRARFEQAVGSYDRSPLTSASTRRQVGGCQSRTDTILVRANPQPATVDVTNENDEILREFAEYGSVLLTWPLNGSRRDHYVAVPVCGACKSGASYQKDA